MIDLYPSPVKHQNSFGDLPTHSECKFQCRPAIIAKLIELYPESCDNAVFEEVIPNVDTYNFHEFSSLLKIMYTFKPMSLYRRLGYVLDIDCRRRVLHLLPRHAFTPTHDVDYQDLNWQPRAAMMMILSQMKIHQSSREHQQEGSSTSIVVDILLREDSSGNK
jgi:hypothetical protein